MESIYWQSDTFRVPGATYMRLSLGHLGIGIYLLAALYVGASCFACAYDVRYGIVALMFLLIVLPALLAIFILAKMFEPAAVRATIPHRVTVYSDGSIGIEYAEDETAGRSLPDDELIPAGSIRELKRGRNYVVLRTADKRIIPIPSEGVKLPQTMIERLSSFD